MPAKMGMSRMPRTYALRWIQIVSPMTKPILSAKDASRDTNLIQMGCANLGMSIAGTSTRKATAQTATGYTSSINITDAN